MRTCIRHQAQGLILGPEDPKTMALATETCRTCVGAGVVTYTSPDADGMDVSGRKTETCWECKGARKVPKANPQRCPNGHSGHPG